MHKPMQFSFAVTCPTLTAPANGEVGGDSGNNFGDVKRFRCKSGSTLIGETTTKCNISGKWSAKPPTCQSKFRNAAL